MARKKSGLVAKIAGTAAVIATAVGVVAGGYANGGVISIANVDRKGNYSASEICIGNIEGGQEGADENDLLFDSPSDLEIYSNEPGFKAGINAKPINTFGWLFNLGVKVPLVGADNYIRFRVDDSTDIPRLVAYDLANPSVVYNIPIDGSEKEIPIVFLAEGGGIIVGEYAHWRLDIIRNTKMPGDANLDGKVDDLDASVLASNWQKTGPGCNWGNGDFNEDKKVDDLDASILAANWQAGVTPANSIPEPSAGLLIALGIGTAYAVRKRRVSQ